MDWFDRRVVRYMLAWAPRYPIRDEETFPEFGMTGDQLRDRFDRIVATATEHIGGVSEEDRQLLARARAYQRWSRYGKDDPVLAPAHGGRPSDRHPSA